MSGFQVTFAFSDAKSCADFQHTLLTNNLQQESFDISIPDRKIEFGNELLTLLVTFYDGGGLEALGALASLLKTILDKTFSGKRKYFKIYYNKNEANIHTNMSADEIKEVLNAKIFQEF